jgi:sporulation protein YlmC with PRC-barrel domain
MANREVHLELLLGHKVYDSEGEYVGRVEEVVARRQGDEWVVEEYWVGTSALLYRLSARGAARALLGLFAPKEHAGYRVPWDKLDLSGPGKRLRLDCACGELEELSGSAPGGRRHRTKTKKSKK